MKFFILLFLFSINLSYAGIAFDLDDPDFKNDYVEAVQTANDNLNKSQVQSFGASPSEGQCVVESKPKPTPAIIRTKKEEEQKPPMQTGFKGAEISTFQMIEETNFSCAEKSKIALKVTGGKTFKNVCPEFLEQLSLHGIARLQDGSVVQFSKTVKVEKIVNGQSVYIWEKHFALAHPTCPYGQTAGGICLEPYRSIIVDAETGLQAGDMVYVDEFKDVIIPPQARHGGYFIVAAISRGELEGKPEVHIFTGSDAVDNNPLISYMNAITPIGFMLHKVTSQEQRDNGAMMILEGRKNGISMQPKPRIPPVVRGSPSRVVANQPPPPPTEQGSIEGDPLAEPEPSDEEKEIPSGEELIKILDGYFPRGGGHYNMQSLGSDGPEKICESINAIIDGKKHPPAHVSHCTIAGYVGMLKVLQQTQPEKWAKVKESFRCNESIFSSGYPYAIINKKNEFGVKQVFEDMGLGIYEEIKASDTENLHRYQDSAGRPFPKAGDVVLIDRNNKTGHLTIFSHFELSEGKVTRYCYWSSNGKGNLHNNGSGYGRRCESIEDIYKLNIGSFQ